MTKKEVPEDIGRVAEVRQAAWLAASLSASEKVAQAVLDGRVYLKPGPSFSDIAYTFHVRSK